MLHYSFHFIKCGMNTLICNEPLLTCFRKTMNLSQAKFMELTERNIIYPYMYPACVSGYMVMKLSKCYPVIRNYSTCHLRGVTQYRGEKLMNENPSLQEIVELKLVEDAILADYQIDATNNNGIITLTGEVPSEKLAQAAETLIRGLAGVVTV